MTITEPYDTTLEDASSNGVCVIDHPCAGCGTAIPANRKWCSEQCRSRHRYSSAHDDGPADVIDAGDAPVRAEVWTFGAVVVELVAQGLVVSVNIEGLELHLSRPEP